MRQLYRLAPLVLFLAISCDSQLANASDGDLQQYSRTAMKSEAANSANPLTSSLLFPTDGKLITADANAAGKAPVNRGLKQLADIVTGIWCATFGNCAGVGSRTLKSLHVDGNGGAASSASAGNALIHGGVDAQTGNIVAELGNIVAQVGNINADLGDLNITAGNINAFGGKIHALNGDIVADIGILQSLNNVIISGDPGTPRYGQLSKGGVYLYGTLTTNAGANPPQGISIKNQLRAKNIVKHWMRAAGTAGAVTFQDGAGNWSASIYDAGGGKVARYRLRFTMGDAMDNANYSAVCTTQAPDNDQVMFPIVLNDTMTTTVFDVTMFGVLTGSQGYRALNVNAFDVACIVMGQQTT